jgi:hypothetical protein
VKAEGKRGGGEGEHGGCGLLEERSWTKWARRREQLEVCGSVLLGQIWAVRDGSSSDSPVRRMRRAGWGGQPLLLVAGLRPRDARAAAPG